MGAAALLTISRNGENIRSQSIEGESVLGRSDDCDIRLDDRAVSRQHAVLRVVGDGVQIEKKSDFAPLIVNGAECTQAVVKEGDVISIGPYLMRIAMSKKEAAPSAEITQATETPQTPEAAEPPVDGVAENSAEAPAPSEEGVAQSTPAEGEFATAEAVGVETPAGEVPSDQPSGFLADDGDGKTRVGALPKIVAMLRVTAGLSSHEELAINKPEMTIGRGQNCDLVIQDKKSSRKHAVIRQSGIRYIIKDLDSANGTLLNGQAIQEHELSSEDVIKIGETEIKFLALNQDYEEQKKDFIQVTPDLDEMPADEPVDMGQGLALSGMESLGNAPGPSVATQQTASGTGGLSGMISGIAGLGGSGKTPGKKQSLMEKFRAMPPKRQAIVGALVLALLWFVFEDDPEPVKKVKKKNAAVATNGAPGSAASGLPVDAETKRRMDFQRLTGEQKKFIEAQYALAFDYYRNKEYDKTLFELEKIFVLVQDYERAREIESYAKEGKRKTEALQEEKRRKDEEEKFKKKVQEFEKDLQASVNKKDYEKAKEIMAELLTLDPENAGVKSAKKAIEAFEDQKRMEEQQKQVQMEINTRAKDMYKQSKKYQDEGRCYDAMDGVQKIGEIGATELEPIEQAKKLITECQSSIRKRRDPILAKAKQKEQAGEYREAFELYRKATRADPRHGAGYAGMNRIRDTLHQMAKIIYTEGVFAESYSDFKIAQDKFRECMSVAPEDDHYYEVAKKRLAKYLRVSKRKPAEESAK